MDVKSLKAEAKQMEAENEFFRQQCVAEELRARYQCAIFEKMHYFIKWHEIADEYNALLTKHMQNTVIPEDAVLPEGDEELQEELDEMKEESKIITLS